MMGLAFVHVNGQEIKVVMTFFLYHFQTSSDFKKIHGQENNNNMDMDKKITLL